MTYHSKAAASVFAFAMATLGLALSGAPAAAQNKEVTLALGGKNLYSVANIVALMPEMNGYFEEEGLNVTLLQGDSAQTAVQLLAAGRVQLMISNPEAPALAAVNQSVPVKAVYVMARQSPYHFAVTASSAIDDVADFKGKRLGIGSLGSGGATYAARRFQDAGLASADYELVPIGVGAPAFEAVKNGVVDGFVSFDGDLANAVASGYDIRFLPDAEWQTKIYGFNLYALDSYIEAEPDVIRGVGRALAKASVFVAANPEESVRMLWEKHPQSAPNNAGDPAAMESALTVLNAQLAAFHAIGRETQPKWGSQDAQSWSFFVEYLKESGELQGSPDPEQLYTDQFADDYNDFDADAVRGGNKP